MRRPSLTAEQSLELAGLLRNRREEMGLSQRRVAASAGVAFGTVQTLEQGTNLTPTPETLKAIAKVLDLTMSDLFVIADWLPAGELPTLQPYLRAKYGLEQQDAAEIDAYLTRLREKHGTKDSQGPINREDEH